jgi:hypothetical protein
MRSKLSNRRQGVTERKAAIVWRIAGLVAVLCGATAPAAADQSATELLVDPQMTVAAGATIAAGVGEAVARAEDAFIPPRLFSERGIPRRAANIAYRLLKFASFDLPQEQWLMVGNHEVFGHGARLRERFDGPIRYHVDAPVPYGDGGGSTSFEFDRTPTINELLAIRAAGMEADGVAARGIAHRAFIKREMTSRDAMRYLSFELDTFGYVLSTSDESESRGHDVFGFVQDYNRLASLSGARRLTPRLLRREVLVSLANPMLGFAVYGIGRHLAVGDTRVAVPALSIAGVRYLPLFRYQLTPYGTEWSMTNELVTAASGSRLKETEVEVRLGRAPRGKPWGFGVRQCDVAAWRGWRLHLGFDVWRQPDVAAMRSTPSTDDGFDVSAAGRLRLGGELRGRAERPIGAVWFSSAPATAIVDVGLKTRGYVPGELLRGGVVVRAGVGLPLQR